MSKKIICADTKEEINFEWGNYDKYLLTKHWKNLRLKIAEERKHICEKCNKIIKKGYHIHHLTYERIGNEKSDDLMFLCNNCHNKIHNGKIEKYKKSNKNKELNIPKNYINSDNYKNKNQLKKFKYLCFCFNNKKIFSDKDREIIIKHMEEIIKLST